ncbi:MAG: DNA N-6-adenine-methyltransferase [Chloroflexi bacterium]|nr:DNA N-6-adenine-methyltransferase [Chloroflexota bacterium]
MFSSVSVEWATPQPLFEQLHAQYHFTLDPCATPENAKCNKFYTEEDNGLLQDWGVHVVFMNPPYGRGIGKWVEKAWLSSLAGALVVCLLPARTDTAWWHNYCVKGTVTFIRGRLKFGGSKNSAPFPSALVVFSP